MQSNDTTMKTPGLFHREGRTTSLLSHFLFILILFVLPEVLMTLALPHRSSSRPMWGIYGKTVIYVAVFYLNYFLLIPRTVIKRRGTHRILRLVLINIGVIVAALALGYLMNQLSDTPRHFRHPSFLKSVSFLARDVVMLVLTVGLAVALRLGENLRDVEAKHQEMLAVRRQTELDSLKSQLNPHFLFNILNTIYALIALNPEKAQEAVHQLSRLLRYTLYEDASEVELGQEVEFIENYTSLMRMRLGRRPVTLNINLDGQNSVQVPPLLLLPLVENAFKYGNTPETSDPIDITIAVENGRLICSTSNSFVVEPKSGSSKNSGLGLVNVRRRLQLLYGSDASLRTSASDNKFNAILSLPLR